MGRYRGRRGRFLGGLKNRIKNSVGSWAINQGRNVMKSIPVQQIANELIDKSTNFLKGKLRGQGYRYRGRRTQRGRGVTSRVLAHPRYPLARRGRSTVGKLMRMMRRTGMLRRMARRRRGRLFSPSTGQYGPFSRHPLLFRVHHGIRT